MPERKTAEIKIRIEPSVKAQWQQAAADEEIGLSEWMVTSCQQRIELAKSLSEAALTAFKRHQPTAAKSITAIKGGEQFEGPSISPPRPNPFSDIPSIATSEDPAPTTRGNDSVTGWTPPSWGSE